MFGLKYEEIVKKIVEEKELSEIEVKARVEGKLKQLSGLISKEGAAHIVANEMGMKLFSNFTREFKIKDVLPGLGNVNLNGKIVQMRDVVTFNKEGREGKVASITIGDETGVIRVAFWDMNHIKLVEQGQIKVGDILRIKGAYSKENNGFKEIHLGNRGEVIVNPEGVEIGEVKQLNERTQPTAISKKLNELKEGDNNVAVVGTIVQVFEPRFYNVCQQCNKKVNMEGDKFMCKEHGAVAVTENPVLNIYFDDGTDNIRAVAFRDNAMKLIGVESLDDLKTKFNELRMSVLGKQVKIVGRVVKNDMFGRNEFVINQVFDVDINELAQEMLSK